MRFAALAVGAAGLLAGLWSSVAQPSATLLVMPRFDGQLSPCGCTYPMTGGILRIGTVVRDQERQGPTLVLSNGAFVTGKSTQERMKAETAAQTIGSFSVAVANVTPAETAFGLAELLTLDGLAGGRMVASQIREIPQIGRWSAAGDYLVGGVTTRSAALGTPLGVTVLPWRQAVQELVATATTQGLAPLLLIDGGRDEALQAAEASPELAAVVYQGAGDAPLAAEHAGRVLLLPTGERGKTVVRAQTSGAYEVVSLGPQIQDDPTVGRFYATYLKRVDRADLLAATPREPSPPFAGSFACAKCHREPSHVWEHTAHSHALATLAARGHASDPDCVPCHTVGFGRQGGFSSRFATPHLGAVGCESCHGPAGEHAAKPRNNRLPRLGEQVCLKCHTGEQSPRFDFASYWAKIAHK